jgi:hypothetical protein
MSTAGGTAPECLLPLGEQSQRSWWAWAWVVGVDAAVVSMDLAHKLEPKSASCSQGWPALSEGWNHLPPRGPPGMGGLISYTLSATYPILCYGQLVVFSLPQSTAEIPQTHNPAQKSFAELRPIGEGDQELEKRLDQKELT